MSKEIKILYTNWKGKTSERTIIPLEIWYGATEWHPKDQWFLKAKDLNKQAERDFALMDIIQFISDENQELLIEQQLSQATSGDIKEAKLYTDGGSRGNPGPSALGWVIMDMQDMVREKDSYYLGITTNNQAEYQALKEGLEACRRLGIRDVHVFMDSLLVVNQMKGIFKVKNRDLWPIHQAIKDDLNNFSSVSFTHVPRELNKIADGMVNECLDAQKDTTADGTIG
jgi:ribonuclease HI